MFSKIFGEKALLGKCDIHIHNIHATFGYFPFLLSADCTFTIRRCFQFTILHFSKVISPFYTD